MVRYIRNDELYHHGIKDMKWHQRRYQYEDGSYTPLGRVHYGIGEYKDKTVGEKLLATPRAFKNTLATYGYGKYKAKANPSGKYNSTERRFMKKADKARDERLKEKEEKKANAEAAAQKRLEETRARAEEKNKEAAEARKKIEEEEARNREKYKEEADKRADERAKQLDERIKELGKEIDERVKGQGEEPVNGKEEAKSGRFEGFSNEELKKFTERTRLEAEASKAVYEARMAKLGAGQEIINTLIGYGKVGVDAFTTYKNVRNMIDEYNGMHVQNQMQNYAQDLMKDVESIYQTGALKDPETAVQIKEDIYKRQQMIEALGKVFDMTKTSFYYKSGNNNNNNNNGGGKNKNKNK